MNNSKSEKRAVTTVLRLVSATVSSGKAVNGSVDVVAIDFLQGIGLMRLKAVGRKMSAMVDSGKEEVFLVEIDTASEANQKPLKIVQMRGGVCREVDSGRAIYIEDDPGNSDKRQILARGDFMCEWEMSCVPAALGDVEAYRTIAFKGEIRPSKDLLPALEYREEMEELAKPAFAGCGNGTLSPNSGAKKLSSVRAREIVEEDGEGSGEEGESVLPVVEVKRFTPAPVAPKLVIVVPAVEHVKVLQNGHSSPKGIPVQPSMLAMMIPIKRVRPNPDQPRQNFDEGEMQKLVLSIKENGQNDPIEVIEVYGDPNADFEIVKGERRWRAMTQLGLKVIKAIVRTKEEIPDKVAQHRACFIADSYHSKYDNIEYALALIHQQEVGNLSLEQLSTLCSHSISWVSQRLALKKLDPQLLALLNKRLPRSQQLSFSVAQQLVRVPLEEQKGLYQKVLNIKSAMLRVVEAKRLADEIIAETGTGRKRTPADFVKNLQTMIPRLVANVLTAQKYPEGTFASLVENHEPEEVDLMLEQIGQTMEKLQMLGGKIRRAQAGLVDKVVSKRQ